MKSAILVILLALLGITLLAYNILTWTHSFTGKEVFATLEEARIYEDKIRSDAVIYNATVKYMDISNDNTVSWRVFGKDLKSYPYGKSYMTGLDWIICSMALFGFLIEITFSVKRLFPKKVKSVPTLSPQQTSNMTKTMQALTKAAFPGVPVLQPVGNKTTRKRSSKAQMVKDITIPKETSGIIAMRCWNLKNGKLHSMTIGGEWTGKTAIADKKPNSQNNSGIYAHRLGRRSDYNGDVWGIVAMYGRCRIGQDQGIIRAERCDVLLLITDSQEATELSKRYGVPVLITDDNEDLMEKWLISEDGLYWLKHNNDLLRDLTTPKTDPIKQVEEILKQQNF